MIKALITIIDMAIMGLSCGAVVAIVAATANRPTPETPREIGVMLLYLALSMAIYTAALAVFVTLLE